MRPALTAATSAPGMTPQDATPRTPDTLPSIEAVLLQRLLAEVEARQLTRAQPTYVIDQSPASRQVTLVRILWSLLWVLSIIVCVFLVKYIDSQTMAPRTDAGQLRPIERLTASIGDQQKEFSTMVDSLNGLASVIALNSTRTAAIPGILNRLNSNLQQVRAPLVPKRVDLAAAEAAAAPIPMGGHHHPPIDVATVAPQGASVHYNSLGVMDYWLVPRTVSGMHTMVKVVPISQTNAGSFVHDVAEAKDYFLTQSGDWIAVSEVNGNQ
jgi:hypothetical protein